MKSYLYSVKREFWEFKSAFIRLPIISAAVIAAIMIILLTLFSSNVMQIALHANSVGISSGEEENQKFTFNLQEGKGDEISYYYALQQARNELLEARSNVHTLEDNQELAGALKEIENAQKELDKAGIDIQLQGVLENVVTSDALSVAMQTEARAEFDKEIAKLDQEIAEMSEKLNLTHVPIKEGIDIQIPTPPVPPEALDVEAIAEMDDIRVFDSTVEVIGKEQSPDFTKKHINKANDFVVLFFMFYTLVMILVSAYYLLSCLYTDRKDNSILFWKSMPVSETQNVLIKLAVATIALPSIAVLAAIAVSVVYTVLAMIFFASHSITTSAWDIFAGMSIIGYAIKHWFASLVIVLWSLPIFTWVLFASAAAKRSPFLFAVIPPISICFVEEVVFDTNVFVNWLANRLPGANIDGMQIEYNSLGIEQVTSVANLLPNVGFWFGLIISAALVVATIWLRNRRYEI